jgi:carbamoyl-phosphate synthase large subunit
MRPTVDQTRPGALNVLVLGVGGNVSQSIQKALALATVPTRVVAACISAEAAGLYLADRAYVSPLAQSSEFVPWLFDVCERERIDVVLSGSEQVLEALADAARPLRERTGTVSIVSPREVLQTGRDKLLACRWLEQHGLPVPGYADLADPEAVTGLVARCGFPLVAKPRFGKGSDAVLTVRDESQLDGAAMAADMVLGRDAGGIVLQEYLGSEAEEFTAGCFSDREGRVRGTIVMRRRLQAGTTVAAELGEFPDVAATAEAVASALRPLGPCNVQLRLHRGRAVPFEINPRFSGTTAMRARAGFNEVDAALRHFVLGEPALELRGTSSGAVLRYWNEVYPEAEAVDALRRDGSLSHPRAEVERWGLAG